MKKKIKVLIIEDNPGDVLLIMDALEGDDDVEVVEVMGNGEKAIEYLKKHNTLSDQKRPNLVLLDINLPRIDGHEVLQFIKTNDITKELPVVMLSSSSADVDIRKSYREHANCYIVKSSGDKDLSDVVVDIKNFWYSLAELPNRH